jgi:hypothetical protein
MRRETGWAGGEGATCLSGPVSRAYPGAALGTGDGAARPGPGPAPVVLPGRRQSLAAHRAGAAWPRARWPGAPRAGCCPAGSAGCLPPPRVRGGRTEVIVAWRRARRSGRLCRRHQPSPGDAGQAPGCPGLAPSRIRRWCARRVLVDARDRVRAGCDTWPGTWRWPGSLSRAAGRGHDTWPDWRWRAASASCGQPSVPTSPPGPVWSFSNHAVLTGEVFTFRADLGRRGLAGVLPTG